jgi:hypothetical protein
MTVLPAICGQSGATPPPRTPSALKGPGRCTLPGRTACTGFPSVAKHLPFPLPAIGASVEVEPGVGGHASLEEVLEAACAVPAPWRSAPRVPCGGDEEIGGLAADPAACNRLGIAERCIIIGWRGRPFGPVPHAGIPVEHDEGTGEPGDQRAGLQVVEGPGDGRVGRPEGPSDVLDAPDGLTRLGACFAPFAVWVA